MTTKKTLREKKNDESLGLNSEITRRDFIGGTLLGSGAALLAMKSPSVLRKASAQTMNTPLSGLGPGWTGPGGLGDYSEANGNTHKVINAAHAAIRNREYDQHIDDALDSDDTYDLVVVGAGFAGVSATLSYTMGKKDARCLILDDHAMFGGEAKQNEFEVDGTHLWAPQGSHGTMYPISLAKEWGESHDFWQYCGLPDEFTWQELSGTEKDIKVPWDVYSPMGFAWEQADTGFFYDNHGFVKNPMQNGFRDAPIPEDMKRELTAMELNREAVRRPDWETWLDSISYADFLKARGVDPRVTEFLDPYVGAVGLGLGCDAVSAYSAYNFLLPHTTGQFLELGLGDISDRSHLMSLPGGNGGVLRHFVKKLIPDAIPGNQSSLQDVQFNRVNFSALDKPGQAVRMRLSATVMDVRQEGASEKTETVRVTYLKDGKLHRVRAKGVVMACGQWVNKRIVRDLSSEYVSAMDFFQHAPMLTLNVAVRNWKYMDKLGIAAARWFEGFGWWLSLKRQVLIDGKEPMPLDPNKPTVFTLYIPFPIPGMPVEQQTVAARMKLFNMSYREIEREIREQFTKMFSPYGFDPKRDIAGIIANRWGHAYVVPQPGFFFGKNGKKAPKDVIRENYGRVAFAHSELSGMQVWPSGAREGERAGKQLL
jgi:spermidine dehydrogenase